MYLHSIAYWVDENVEAPVKRSYLTRARAKTKTNKADLCMISRVDSSSWILLIVFDTVDESNTG